MLGDKPVSVEEMATFELPLNDVSVERTGLFTTLGSVLYANRYCKPELPYALTMPRMTAPDEVIVSAA